MDQSYVKCYPDVMGATHTGDDNRYYKYTSNGYMLLEGDEWDYVNYLPDLRRLDDIRTTVKQTYEIQRLSLVVIETKDKRIAELEDLAQMIIDAESADPRVIPLMYNAWLHKAKALKEQGE